MESKKVENVIQQLKKPNTININYLSDESNEEEDSDLKSLSSIRELLIDNSFSQENDIEENDKTESEIEKTMNRSIISYNLEDLKE